MDKMQMEKLLSALDEMAGMIATMKDSLGGDAAEEQAEDIDSATAGETEQETDDSQLKSADDKQMRKAAAVQMLRRQMSAE